ncbi:hypothetical protein AC628_10020 [Bradyrhizobium sp. NAS96.2]|nr:hypothetical protein AC628_10020 [Bradyrhizobium sp. NAS96.2]
MADIDAKIGEVRTDAIDLSFGEIINLKRSDEIKIDPDYQRLFRWSEQQKSRLVESVLLRLPIPPIFFIENEDGRYELIDGLQRVSSIAQFIDSEIVDKPPLILDGCDIVPNLNGLSFADLPLTLRLQLKRSGVRALVIKRQSKDFLRYEMFKRLNTGGSELSEQELRNCSARIFGEKGIAFYEFLIKMSKLPAFAALTETLAEVDQEKRGREELALRFFAAKEGTEYYHGNVAEWLNSYMEAVLLEQKAFDYEQQEVIFKRVFGAVSRVAGEGAFCKYKNGQPIGGLAPAYYEAVVCAFERQLEKVETANSAALNAALIAARESESFKSNVGTGANKRSKLIGRISVLEEAIKSV